MKQENKTPSIMKTTEGVLLALGMAIFFALLSVVVYFLINDTEKAKALVLTFVAHLFGGRAVGVGLCLEMNFNSVQNVVYNFLIEALIVFICYSVCIFSIKYHLKLKFLNKPIRSAEKKAHKYESVISKYGYAGLFFFVMIPLPVTGPVIGSFMGYFLKIKLRWNLLFVLSGTLVSIVLWVLFFDYMDKNLHVFEYVFWVIIAFVFIFFSKTIKGWFAKEV